MADPAALERCRWPEGARVLRVAPDDVLLLGEGRFELDDPHAIVEPESMYAGTWLGRDDIEEWLSRRAEWMLPAGDGLSQGMAAALPVKIWVEGDRGLVIVPVSLAAELEARLR